MQTSDDFNDAVTMTRQMIDAKEQESTEDSRQQQVRLAGEQILQARQEQRNQAMLSTFSPDPSISESVKAGFSNAPIVRWAENQWNTRKMERDPEFDPTLHMWEYLDELGYDSMERLADTDSKEEFDYYVGEYREQIQNQQVASKSLLGMASSVVASQASMDNLLFTLATGGVGAWGTVAKTAKQGMLANSFKTGLAGGTASFIGASVDADQMVGFSQEDIVWSSLLGTTIGTAYGGLAGRILIPEDSINQGNKLNSFGGAIKDSTQWFYNRAIGKGYQDYKKLNKAKMEARAKLREDIGKGRTAIFKEAIDDFDFDLINRKDVDLDAELDNWWSRNSMDERTANITDFEEGFDQIGGIQSEYAKGRLSKSKTARIMNALGYESGTNSIVKNDSGAVVMETLQQTFSGMYNMSYRPAFHAYWKRKNGLEEASQAPLASRARGYGTAMTNYFKTRADFNQEVYQYMNAVSNGRRVDNVSPEVKQLAEQIDKANEAMHRLLAKSGVRGFDEFEFKKGYLHQRHEKDYYARAVARYGEDTVVNVLRTALMSKHGANITDVDKATSIAKAFVRRFTDKPTDMRAGSILDDEAWELLDEIMRKEGVNLDELGSLRTAFNENVNVKQADAGRARYAKQRMPLDMEAEYGGLRMIDLVNTDVEQLTANYAMSMSGHIALAKMGIKDRNTWNKIRKRIVTEDPEMEEWADNFYRTFSTGRVGGGVDNPYVARALKLTVLSYLNNMGLTQLSESGTSMATYGVANFFENGSKSMKEMFTGKKSVGATGLAKEIDDSLFPIAKEHVAMPPHLAQELQSNSRLATSSLGDATDMALNVAMTAQGYTSLFNHARSAQHSIAFNGLMHKIGRYIHKGKQLDEQLASLGMSERLFDDIKRNISKKGVINKDGSIDKLGIHNWDAKTRENFLYILARNQNSIVQKAMAGEGSAWMSQSYGSLLTQFRKFPIESMRKQLIRKGTISQGLLVQSAMLNLAVAGSVITARNYLTGGDTSIDLPDALRNGIAYNADLGSIASIWDIGISLSGAPQAMYLNPYAVFNDGAVFSVPALSAVNNAMQLPATYAEGLTPFNDLEPDDYRNLRGTPILGNHFALSAIFQRPD